jgi:hypothetical protein
MCLLALHFPWATGGLQATMLQCMHIYCVNTHVFTGILLCKFAHFITKMKRLERGEVYIFMTTCWVCWLLRLKSLAMRDRSCIR